MFFKERSGLLVSYCSCYGGPVVFLEHVSFIIQRTFCMCVLAPFRMLFVDMIYHFSITVKTTVHFKTRFLLFFRISKVTWTGIAAIFSGKGNEILERLQYIIKLVARYIYPPTLTFHLIGPSYFTVGWQTVQFGDARSLYGKTSSVLCCALQAWLYVLNMLYVLNIEGTNKYI